MDRRRYEDFDNETKYTRCRDDRGGWYAWNGVNRTSRRAEWSLLVKSRSPGYPWHEDMYPRLWQFKFPSTFQRISRPTTSALNDHECAIIYRNIVDVDDIVLAAVKKTYTKDQGKSI